MQKTNVPAIANNQDALRELMSLGVILEERDGLLTLDTQRLALLGYVLTFDGFAPVFTRLSDVRFLRDCTLYSGNVVPTDTLGSYRLSVVKCLPFSP